MQIRLLVYVLAVAIAAPTFAQDLLVSKKVSGFNFNARAAVSSRGDVLVTWTQWDFSDSTYSQIWAVLLKKGKNGFKVRKAQRISDLGVYNMNARPAWSAADRSFLVVWDTFGLSGAEGSILGRTLKKNGKPKGQVVTIVDDGAGNLAPVLVGRNTRADPLRLYHSRVESPTRSTGRDEQSWAVVGWNLAIFGQAPTGSEPFFESDSTTDVIRSWFEPGIETPGCSYVVLGEGTAPNTTLYIQLVRGGTVIAQVRLRDATPTAVQYNESTAGLSVFGIDNRSGKPFRWGGFMDCAAGIIAGVEFEELLHRDPAWVAERDFNVALARAAEGTRLRTLDQDQWIYADEDGELKISPINGTTIDASTPLLTVGTSTFLRAIETTAGNVARAATPAILVLWTRSVGGDQEIRAFQHTPR